MSCPHPHKPIHRRFTRIHPLGSCFSPARQVSIKCVVVVNISTFINGPLLRFVKSIQEFLIKFKCKNISMLYVCLSQIRKCLLMYEMTMLEQNTIINFKKVLNTYLIKRIQKCFYKLEECLETLDLTNVDEHPGIFIDRMNIVLNGLNNKDNFELMKPYINKIVFQAITIAKISDNIDNLEITSSSKHVLKAIQHIENMNINEIDNFFHFDYLSSSLSILERRINKAILNLIFKIFNDPFCIIKKLVRKCKDSGDIHLRNSSDLSSMISDLDKSTDALIQIGLFSVACCKNVEYAIPLKCCISSLELLDSDMIPAIIEFYLDPTSIVKKAFLKLLINHWVSEICEMQNFLDKIIDPFAFTQTTLDISMSITDTIYNSDQKANIGLYVKFLNGLVNFTKYIEKNFATQVPKDNDFSTSYKQFKSALNEYKACLIFNENTSHDYLNESMKKKLLKRSDIVIKYLKNIQTSIFHIMDNKCLSELENTYYILSKSKHYSKSLEQNDILDDNDNLNLLLSTIQVQRSFYNKSERKNSRIYYNENYFLTDDNETTYENTITMDLTNILDNFIEVSNMNNEFETTVKIWEEIDINTPTRMHDIEI